jgi:hypothetical protein
MTEFEGWLRKGLGRAAVFLKRNDSRQWREELLYACTRNLAYDRQCEDSRACYLLDLIEISGDTDFYRDRIVASLAADEEDLDLDQMFEIAARFAADGSVAARTAMYSAFERHGFSGAGLSCAEQLVILDGLGGLISVAKSFHEVEADDRPWKFGALIEALEKHHGKQGLPVVLDGFVQEWRDYEALCETERQNPPAARPGYEEINRKISEKGRSAGMIYWSKCATEEELANLAQDVLSESDSDRLYGFLRMFQLRAFPGPLDRLIELVCGTDEGVSRAAMMALSHSSHPTIRALALDLANKSGRGESAVRLLTRNGDGDDYGLVEQFLRAEHDADDYHRLGFAVRQFVEVHREGRAQHSLLLLYENGPCALCRRGVIRELIAIQGLPQWMKDECRYDYVETRKLVESIP